MGLFVRRKHKIAFRIFQNAFLKTCQIGFKMKVLQRNTQSKMNLFSKTWAIQIRFVYLAKTLCTNLCVLKKKLNLLRFCIIMSYKLLVLSICKLIMFSSMLLFRDVVSSFLHVDIYLQKRHKYNTIQFNWRIYL